MDTTITAIGGVVVAALENAGYKQSTIGQYRKSTRFWRARRSIRLFIRVSEVTTNICTAWAARLYRRSRTGPIRQDREPAPQNSNQTSRRGPFRGASATGAPSTRGWKFAADAKRGLDKLFTCRPLRGPFLVAWCCRRGLLPLVRRFLACYFFMAFPDVRDMTSLHQPRIGLAEREVLGDVIDFRAGRVAVHGGAGTSVGLDFVMSHDAELLTRLEDA